VQGVRVNGIHLIYRSLIILADH